MTISGDTTLSGLSEGTHNIIVHAKDTAGNTGASETIYFTIDTQPEPAEPTQLWIVGLAVAVIGTAIAAILLWRRRK